MAHVTPGEPVKIGGSTIVVEGDARNDADYKAWVKQGRPEVGSQLNHGQYDKFKSGFSNLALRNGYFDGTFKKASLVSRLSGVKRSGISTTTVANAIASATLLSRIANSRRVPAKPGAV